jgi:hypothetical protein
MKAPLPPDAPAGKHEQVAQLARMFGDEALEHKDALTRASGEYHRAWKVMENLAQDAGIIKFGNHENQLSRMFHAGHHVADILERRVKALEKILRDVLASDYATDEQRDALMRALHGRTSPGRDPKLLSETEAALVAHYRAMAQHDKQMLRTLLGRLAEIKQEAKSP